MKKKIKRAFTLVELLVVIAILAILATVSIVGYNSFTKKAKVSNDTALVSQLNGVLKADSMLNGNASTPTDALKVTEEAGYDVEKLTPTASNYEIIWNQEVNQFALLDENDNVVYGEKNTDEYKNWKFVSEYNTASDYSVYLKGTSFTSVPVIHAGLDVGNNTGITTINYTNDTKKENVVIRTNGGQLNITAPNDSIKFYGTSNNVIVDEIANSSFHVFGSIIDTLTVKKGHIILESSSIVIKLVSEDVVTVDSKNGATLVDNTDIKNESAKTNTSNAVKNAESKPYLNVSNTDEMMNALGYDLETEKNCYYSNDNVKYNGIIRLKKNANIDLSTLKIDNKELNCSKRNVINVNSSIDLNGGTIKTANMAFLIRKDNVTIYNGTFQAADNKNKATGINSYALGVEANNVKLVNLISNGGISIGFDYSAKNAIIENCTVKSGDWYAVCAQAGSSVTVKNGEFSRTEIVNNGNYEKSYIFQVEGDAGDFGIIGDVNNINFVNVKSSVDTPFDNKLGTATVSSENSWFICNGSISYKITKK